MTIKDLFKTLKPSHYFKNLTILIPILFSENISNLVIWLDVLIIFSGFCFVSSAIYILNDLIDVEKDKLHPIKCNRPIALGTISKTSAIILLSITLAVGLTIAIITNYQCFYVLIFYFALNIFYSIWLKNFAIVDTTTIAIGFVLRLLSGYFVISEQPSLILILTTFFVSNFFTYTKRSLELQLTQNTRKSLEQISLKTLNRLIKVNLSFAIIFYVLYIYVLTVHNNGSKYFYLSVPIFVLIICRVRMLSNTKKLSDDPMIYIEKDLITKILFLIYFSIFFIIKLLST